METDKSESLSLTGLSLEGHGTGNWHLNSSEITQSGFCSWAMCAATTMQYLTLHMARTAWLRHRGPGSGLSVLQQLLP